MCCPLCGKQTDMNRDVNNDVMEVRCNRCGTFKVSKKAQTILSLEDKRHLLSGVTRECWDRNHEPILISSNNIKELKRLAPDDKDVSEKSRRFLLALGRMSRYPGDTVRCNQYIHYPLAYCLNESEFYFFVQHLEKRRFLACTYTSASWDIQISADGWAEIERCKTSNIDSDKVFVAMWFDKQMDSAYDDAIRPAIEEDCGYKAIRIDLKEFTGDIVDEIIAEIRESRFVVADFTDQRHGVYFEAGFAQGLGLPVILTCREDDIENLHFDTNHQNHIPWKTPEELRQRLANRIRAIIGLGPHKKA